MRRREITREAVQIDAGERRQSALHLLHETDDRTCKHIAAASRRHAGIPLRREKNFAVRVSDERALAFCDDDALQTRCRLANAL